MSELLIRPSHNDHVLIADLLAPGGRGRAANERPPISRLVLPAPLGAREPSYAQAAEAAGVPVIIDPLTHLLQTGLDPSNALSHQGFATTPISPALADDREKLDFFVSDCLEAQLMLGATHLVVPYFHAASPDDPWFRLALASIESASRYRGSLDIGLPLVPVLSAQGNSFGRLDRLESGVERFATYSRDAGARLVGMQLSPMGAPKDNYDRVLKLFIVARHLRRTGLSVHAWRQGIYGPALVAAGIEGYETGITTREQTDTAGERRRASRPKQGAPVGPYVLLGGLGRSLPKKTVKFLERDFPLAQRLQCTDSISCCPDGLSSTMGESRRSHAIRERARYLLTLDSMPPRDRWRLGKVMADAQQASTTLALINPVLRAANQEPIASTWLTSLHDVARFLRGDNTAAA